jgi:hypothetical protein
LDAPAADTVIHPLTLGVLPFPGGSLSRSTKTLTSVGVVAPAGLTTIQGALLTAFHVSCVPPTLVNRTCSSRRTHARVELGMKQKPMALSLNAMAPSGRPTAFTITRTLCGELEAPAAAIVIDPETGRNVGSFRGSIDTVTPVGVVPPAGETTIQALLLVALHLSGVLVLATRSRRLRDTHIRLPHGV